MTSLTTSICIDILGVERKERSEQDAKRIRKRVHIAVVLAFLTCILLFRVLSSQNVINTIYVMASYTYGPLLGLYAFGMFTKRTVRRKSIPYICIAAPLICAALDYSSPRLWGYTFGYELLMLNGLITFMALYLASIGKELTPSHETL